MRRNAYLRCVVWLSLVVGMVEGLSWLPAPLLRSAPAIAGPSISTVRGAADLVVVGNSRSRALDLDLVRQAYVERAGREPVIADLRMAGTDGLNQYALVNDYLASARSAPGAMVAFVSLEDVLTSIPTLPEVIPLRRLPELLAMGLEFDQALNLAMAKINWLYANKSRVNSEVMERLLAALRPQRRATDVEQGSGDERLDWNDRLERHCSVAELGRVDPVKVRAIQWWLERCGRASRVLLVLPPYHEEMRPYLVRSGSYREFQRAVESFRKISGVTVVDDRFFISTNRVDFFDPTHLEPEATKRFTQQLLAQYAALFSPALPGQLALNVGGWTR